MSNFQLRVLTTLIYFPLILLSVFQINVFTLVLLILLAGALHEFFRMLIWPTTKSQLIAHIGLVVLGTAPFLSVILTGNLWLGFVVMAVAYQVYIVVGMVRKMSFRQVIDRSSAHVFGYLMLSGLFSAVLLLWPFGEAIVWFLFVIVGATDTGAYLVGKRWGKTPFFEWISPKKTWEGGVAGVASAIIMAGFFHQAMIYFQFPMPPLSITFLMGAVVAVASIFGDLLVSMIKRQYKIKDAGKLFLGHGGVLDRFDGLLFAGLPLLAIMLCWKSLA